ncbi:hypothetical protein CYY_002396 [Polysphondylium violaceum]|uniref:Uncharacterized protein n=1 Tax=Polysphondylium violaceum TaxID=133409 RepID=A0A8J4PYG5_9MYCE|nr:hypothetical protein CYY_002396 [Polysphondylium violaceum]
MIGLNLLRTQSKSTKKILFLTSRVLNTRSVGSNAFRSFSTLHQQEPQQPLSTTRKTNTTTTTITSKKGIFRSQIEQQIQPLEIIDGAVIPIPELPTTLSDSDIITFRALIGKNDSVFVACLEKICNIADPKMSYAKLNMFLSKIQADKKVEHLLKTYYFFQSLSKKPTGYAYESIFLIKECLIHDQPALAKAFYCLSKTLKTYPQFHLILDYYLEKKDFKAAGVFFQEFHILYPKLWVDQRTPNYLSILAEYMDVKQVMIDSLVEYDSRDIPESDMSQLIKNCFNINNFSHDLIATIVEGMAEGRDVGSNIYRNVIKRFIIAGDTKNTLRVFSSTYSKVNLGYSVFQALYTFLPLDHNPKALSGFINAFLDSMTVIDPYPASIELSVAIIYNQLKSSQFKESNPALAEKSATILNSVKEGLRHFPSSYVKNTIYNIVTFYLHHDQYDLALQWFSDSLLEYRLSHSIELFSCFLFYHKCREYQFVYTDRYPLATIKPSPNDSYVTTNAQRKSKRKPETVEEMAQKEKEIKDKYYHNQLFKFWQQHSETLIPDRKPILKLLEQYQNLDVSLKLRFVENFFKHHETPIDHLLPNTPLNTLNATDKELTLMLKHNDHNLIIDYLNANYFSKNIIPQGSLLIECAVLLKSSHSYVKFYDSVPTFVKVLLVNPYVEEASKLNFGDKIMKVTPLDSQLRPRNEHLYHMCFSYAINNNMVPLVYDILHSILYCQIQHWMHPLWKEVLEEWPLPEWKELSTLVLQYSKAYGTNKLFSSLYMTNYYIRIKLESGQYSECLSFIKALSRGSRDEKTMEYTIKLYRELFPLENSEKSKVNIKEWQTIKKEHFLLDVDLTPTYYQHLFDTLLAHRQENQEFILEYINGKFNEIVSSINESTLYSLLNHFTQLNNTDMVNRLFIEYTKQTKGGWPKEKKSFVLGKVIELMKVYNNNNNNETIQELLSKQQGPFEAEEVVVKPKRTYESGHLIKSGIEGKIRMILDHNNHFQNEIRLGDNLSSDK